jgi:catechol 2,3-dioxygenase-like lactoylglutathione lyase family enzyme
MITGAHAILYSTDPEADRAFLRDVLGLTGVDAGGGWLIFGLPPAEVAVHPAETSGQQELYLICDDVEAFVADVRGRGIACGPIEEQRWGRITRVTLPGGGGLGVYEARHARPAAAEATARAPRKAAGRRVAKVKAKKKAKTTRAPKRGARGGAKKKARRR